MRPIIFNELIEAAKKAWTELGYKNVENML